MKILIVDDEFSNRMVLQSLLGSFGDVCSVASGKEAIAYFKLAMDLEAPFDVVMLDIMMPETDGHQVLDAIRSAEETARRFGEKSARIVMTTALSDGKNVFESFKKQCDAYIVKPVDLGKIQETFRKIDIPLDGS